MIAAALALCRRARSRGMATAWTSAPDLGAVLVTGADAGSFLQSQLTSDVLQLGPGAGQPSARLDRRGALQTALTIFRLPDQGQPFPTYLLIVAADGCRRLVDDMAAFVISEDVIVETASRDFVGWVLQGPDVPRALAALAAEDISAWTGAAAPRLMPLSGTGAPTAVWALSLSLTGDPGFLLLQPTGVQPALADAVAAAATAHELEIWPDDATARLAWEWLRVEAGTPRLGRDLAPGQRVLPQTGLEQQVVSTTKGCYLGQEVVARIRTYGSVPEALRGLVFDGLVGDVMPDLPAPGEQLLTADGQNAGTWGTGALSTVWSAPVALAFVKRDQRTPGTRLEVVLADGESTTAEVVLLPFHRAADRAEQARHLHERAVHVFSRGRDDEAIRLLEGALRLDPSLAEAYESLGVILGRSERFHEAIDIFRQLEEVAPDEPMVHTNLSLFYMKIGDKEQAEEQKAQATLKRFAALDGGAQQAQAAEAEQTRREEAERKLAMFGEVLAIDPDDPLALMGRGNALLVLERFTEAEEHLARARRVQKDNSPLYAAHGKVLEQLGRTEDAVTVYREGVTVASRKGDLMPLKEMEHRLLMLGEMG